MGRVADAAGIQFRLLNRSKGPAVHGPRTQADRKLYRQAMQAEIAATPCLTVVEGGVEDLVVRDGRVVGVVLSDGREIAAGAVVLTTGTFLNGLIHMGERQIPAGRVGEAPALKLSRPSLCAGPAHGPPEDRHAAETRRQVDRLVRARNAARRRRADAVFVSYRQNHDAADRLRHHADDTGDARHHPREPDPFADVFRARSAASGRAIARRSRTRSCASRTAPRTRFSSNPRDSTTIRSIRTASRPRFPSKFSRPS